MADSYYVGERPSAALAVQLNRTDGTPYDLSSYEDVELEGAGLPTGTTTVVDAAGGRVKYDFDAPFEQAGLLEIRARLTTLGGAVDYGSPMTLSVSDPMPGAGAAVATTSDVEAITGSVVSANQVARARGMIALASGVDLSDQARYDQLRSSDRSLIRQAVCWQAEGLSTGVVQETLPSGAASISNGDVSIGFGSNGSGAAPWLAPLAAAALARCSWHRSRTQFARPTRAYDGARETLTNDNHAWRTYR